MTGRIIVEKKKNIKKFAFIDENHSNQMSKMSERQQKKYLWKVSQSSKRSVYIRNVYFFLCVSKGGGVEKRRSRSAKAADHYQYTIEHNTAAQNSFKPLCESTRLSAKRSQIINQRTFSMTNAERNQSFVFIYPNDLQ